MFNLKNFLLLCVLVFFSSCKLVKKSTGSPDPALKSSENKILSFSINEVNGEVLEAEVLITFERSTNLSSLVPIIGISEKATIEPKSGVAQNFSNPVVYTVRAEDGTEKKYLVNANFYKSNEKEIISFSVLGVEALIENNLILISFPAGTDLSQSLLPSIEISEYATISPSLNTYVNFSQNIEYLVTAENGTNKTYTVNSIVLLSDKKDILSFIVEGYHATINDNYITLILPDDEFSSLLDLNISFEISANASISPDPLTLNDFTTSFYLETTAEDGSNKTYLVDIDLGAIDDGLKYQYQVQDLSFNMVYIHGSYSFPTTTLDNIYQTVDNAYWVGETELSYKNWYYLKNWASSNAYVFYVYTGREGNTNNSGVPSQDINEPLTYINFYDAMVLSNALTHYVNTHKNTNYSFVYLNNDGEPIKQCVNNLAVCNNVVIDSNANGFRLLDANEWELAARYQGVNPNSNAIEYPQGSGIYWTPGAFASGAAASYSNYSALDEVAWFDLNSYSKTHDLKLKKANKLGIYDMSGNVSELTNTLNPTNLTSRVHKGGSFSGSNHNQSVGRVSSISPSSTYNSIGIRIGRKH